MLIVEVLIGIAAAMWIAEHGLIWVATLVGP